jgi:hypothetical protein
MVKLMTYLTIYLVVGDAELTPRVIRTGLALFVLYRDVLILRSAVVPVARAFALADLYGNKYRYITVISPSDNKNTFHDMCTYVLERVRARVSACVRV